MVKSSFTGKGRIYRKNTDWGAKYTIQMSKKDKDNNWAQAYMPISFKKGIELQDRQDIELVRCWLDFYLKRDGTAVWQLFCLEFTSDTASQEYLQGSENFEPISDIEDTPF